MSAGAHKFCNVSLTRHYVAQLQWDLLVEYKLEGYNLFLDVQLSVLLTKSVLLISQRDPLVEYKLEGYNLFLEMMANIRRNVIYNVYVFQPRRNLEASACSKRIPPSPCILPQHQEVCPSPDCIAPQGHLQHSAVSPTSVTLQCRQHNSHRRSSSVQSSRQRSSPQSQR